MEKPVLTRHSEIYESEYNNSCRKRLHSRKPSVNPIHEEWIVVVRWTLTLIFVYSQ